MSDPGVSYRKREEISKMRDEKDPIEIVKHLLFDHKLASEDEVGEIQDKIKENISKTAAEALKDAWPEKNELFTHIYSDNRKYFLRNVELKDSIVL